LKNSGNRKQSRTQSIIGCSFEELKQHLESGFHSDMSWDNIATWDVGHIVPVAAFDLSDPVQLRACFNRHNLAAELRSRNRSHHNQIDRLTLKVGEIGVAEATALVFASLKNLKLTE
jgi:hypothetical protein